MIPNTKQAIELAQECNAITKRMQELRLMPAAVAKLTGLTVTQIMNVIHVCNPAREDIETLKRFLNIQP